MPVVQQVVSTTIPVTTQSTFRQLTGELLEWAPDLPVQMAQKFLNNTYRRVVDSRLWYGLLRKGQVTSPDAVTGGTVNVTNNSTTIVGTGTAFDPIMVGRQFRVGFSNPIYTIATVTSATQLDLDLVWGGKTQTNVSYTILQNIVSLGANVKRVLAMVNQRQGYRLKLNIPQEALNIYDTWRATTGWTYILANYIPSADGQPQWELYPAPTFQQSFPFLVYIQPPDMVQDGDFPAAFIRSDVIMYGAIPHVLRFRGKNSRFYDPQTAMVYEAMFQSELQAMSRNDDNQYPKDLLYEFSRYPFTQYGASYWQSHDADAGFL